MKWEWAIGEIILIALGLYELWSLRKYKKEDAEAKQREAAKSKT